VLQLTYAKPRLPSQIQSLGDRQEEADHERVVRWNLTAMTADHVEASEKLLMKLAKQGAHLDGECTANEVEQQAAWCPDAIGSVLYATAMRITICTKSKMWRIANIMER